MRTKTWPVADIEVGASSRDQNACVVVVDDPDAYDRADLYGSSQTLDREPTLGQVPMLSPDTPTSDGWIPPHFAGLTPAAGPPYIPGQSTGLTMASPMTSPMTSPMHSESMVLLGAASHTMPPHGGAISGSGDAGEHEPNYPDYHRPSPTQNHVAVY